MERLQIKNAKVVLPESVRDDLCVLIEDGKIIALTMQVQDPGKWKTLDAKKNYLAPGFIDLHNHGRLGADAMEARPEVFEKIAAHQLSRGVTGFLLTTQSAPADRTAAVISAAVKYIKNPAPNAAVPLGIYMEGPYFSSAKKGAQLLDGRDIVDLDGLLSMLEAGRGHVRIVALAPELPGALEGIDLIKKYGAAPSAGHTESGYDQTMAAIDRGLVSATHTFNAMAPLGHRDPGAVGACLTDDRVFCEAISDGIHLHPAIVRLIYMAKGPDRMVLVSDSIAGAGLPDGDYDYSGRKVTIRGGEIRLEGGTLAGSALSLNGAVKNAVSFTGCPLHEAVKMASLTPARLIGFGGKKGSIEAGKDADLILFNREFEIKSAFIGGMQAFEA